MENISLFIPHVFTNITEERIKTVVETNAKLGKVNHIDFVSKTGADGKTYNSVYIHFDEWYTNDHATSFHTELLANNKVHLTYDKNWFWIVLVNKTQKKTVVSATDMDIPSTPPRSSAPKSPPKLSKKPKKGRRHIITPSATAELMDSFDAVTIAQMEDIEQNHMPMESMKWVDASYVKHLEQQNANLYKTVMQYHALCFQMGGGGRTCGVKND